MEKKKDGQKDNRELCSFLWGGGVSSLQIECETVNFVLYIFFVVLPIKKKHLLKKFQTLTSCKCMMMSHTVKALTS